MSAFFVGPDHVNAMLTYAAHRKIYMPTPTGEYRFDSSVENMANTVGRVLLAENIESLKARYPKDFRELLGGFDLNKYEFEEDASWLVRPDSDLATVKLCACYDYQSCEHGGWESSLAKKISEKIALSAAFHATTDSMPWGYERDPRHTVVSLSSLTR